MRALLRKPKAWIILLTLALLSLLLFLPIKNVLDVAAVQNAVEQDFGIGFIDGSNPQGGAPAILPDLLNRFAIKVLTRLYEDAPEDDSPQPAKTRNRDEVYYVRFQAFFRGPIRGIIIYDFKAFTGDLGKALSRFRGLQSLRVYDFGFTPPSEAEWLRLCASLRSQLNLEEIELGGAWVTDAALAPLAGHSNLRTIDVSCGRLTDGCAKTFATIPHLSRLRIANESYDGAIEFPPEKKAAIIAALPRVTVEFYTEFPNRDASQSTPE